MKDEIKELIRASKELMNNYNSDYLTAGEEQTLYEMKLAIDAVEKANGVEQIDGKCNKHDVMDSVCPNCGSSKYNLGYYKRLMICEDCEYTKRAK